MEKDYTGGDHSFANWFKIMWKNSYIQLFFIFLLVLIIQITHINFCIELLVEIKNDNLFSFLLISFAMAMPLLVVLVIIHKGFLQFWNDLKNGRSR